MGGCLLSFLLLLFETGKVYENVLLVHCYDEQRMHEAMERASHEKYTEQEMLVTVIEYIAGHKFFAHDPRNGKVHNQLESRLYFCLGPPRQRGTVIHKMRSQLA